MSGASCTRCYASASKTIPVIPGGAALRARLARNYLPDFETRLNILQRKRPLFLRILDRVKYDRDRLAVLNKHTKDQNDYLGSLITLTEKYEAEAIADALDRSKSTGLDALKYLMEIHELSQAQLAKVLGVGASAASMILSGDRPITADRARTLAKQFRVAAGTFL